MFHTTDRDGITELNPSEEKMREVLLSLREDDAGDNPEVWLTNLESGWSLSVYPSGLAILENTVQDAPERQLTAVDQAKAFALWKLLAAGETDQLLNEPWQARE